MTDQHDDEAAETAADTAPEQAEGTRGTENAAGPDSGADAPAAKPRKSFPVLLLGAAAALVAVLVLLYVFVWPDSPSTVVDDYFQAVKDADVDELKSLTCSAGVDPFANMDPIDSDEDRALWEELFKDVSWDVKGESVDGDKATVTVALTGLGEKSGTDDSVNLVKEGMYWKVCDSVVDDLGD